MSLQSNRRRELRTQRSPSGGLPPDYAAPPLPALSSSSSSASSLPPSSQSRTTWLRKEPQGDNGCEGRTPPLDSRRDYRLVINVLKINNKKTKMCCQKSSNLVSEAPPCSCTPPGRICCRPGCRGCPWAAGTRTCTR